jgi:hypothetical protein
MSASPLSLNSGREETPRKGEYDSVPSDVKNGRRKEDAPQSPRTSSRRTRPHRVRRDSSTSTSHTAPSSPSGVSVGAWKSTPVRHHQQQIHRLVSLRRTQKEGTRGGERKAPTNRQRRIPQFLLDQTRQRPHVLLSLRAQLGVAANLSGNVVLRLAVAGEVDRARSEVQVHEVEGDAGLEVAVDTVHGDLYDGERVVSLSRSTTCTSILLQEGEAEKRQEERRDAPVSQHSPSDTTSSPYPTPNPTSHNSPHSA